MMKLQEYFVIIVVREVYALDEDTEVIEDNKEGYETYPDSEEIERVLNQYYKPDYARVEKRYRMVNVLWHKNP